MKSVVAKPVVVIMEDTWKAAWCSDWPRSPLYWGAMSQVMRAMAPAMMPR